MSNGGAAVMVWGVGVLTLIVCMTNLTSDFSGRSLRFLSCVLVLRWRKLHPQLPQPAVYVFLDVKCSLSAEIGRKAVLSDL